MLICLPRCRFKVPFSSQVYPLSGISPDRFNSTLVGEYIPVEVSMIYITERITLGVFHSTEHGGDFCAADEPPAEVACLLFSLFDIHLTF